MIRPGSLSPFDNIHSVSLGLFDINPFWFACFLLLIYFSFVSFIISCSSFFLPVILFFFASFLIYFLVFFVSFINNLWFVGFFDDSIRVRLVTLHYIKQKCLLKHHGFIGVIDGTD